MNPNLITTGHPTVTAPGDVLSTTAEALRQPLQAALQQLRPGQALELDLRAARMIDSVGLNLLVTVIKKAKAAGGSVRIRISQSSVQRILHFSRLHQHADIISS